jgi:hypothetical protein
LRGIDRGQSTLFPECLADWIDENNPVQVIDVFVDELDLAALGFDGVAPEVTGRPSYHPSVLLKLYIYGYLNRVQSSRRLERDDPSETSAVARSQHGKMPLETLAIQRLARNVRARSMSVSRERFRAQFNSSSTVQREFLGWQAL